MLKYDSPPEIHPLPISGPQVPFNSPTCSAPELTIVVPTFCEKDNVNALINSISAALPNTRWEVIFVDDDSPDGTAAYVRSIGATDARIRCIRRIARRGLSGACLEGMLASQAPYVAVIDADLQHDEQLLGRMLQAIRGDAAEVVVGSRYMSGGGAETFSSERHSISRAATWLTHRLLHVNISDPMSGFFMVRRDFIEEIAPKLSARGFKILLDILANARECRIIELPYRFRSRQRGASKLDAQVAVDFVELVAVRATYGLIPDRFLSFMLVGAVGIGVHFAALSLAHKLLLVPFAWLQSFAAVAAIGSNFFLNNALTYYDQRLTGYRALLGFCLFSSICSVGLLSNISISTWLYDEHGSWQIAGLFGAAVSAFWNYAVSRRFVWRS